MDILRTEEFMVCPSCGEEAVAALQPGFNIVDCPLCDYFLIVFLDENGQAWTRELGVLESNPLKG